jgi:disulfide oxidoreductase YuzD
MAKETKVRVVVLAVSAGSCAGKPTWQSATNVLRHQLTRRFGDAVSVEYVELFSARSFQLQAVLDEIGSGTLRIPVVLVNDEVLSNGLKLNEGTVARRVAELVSDRLDPNRNIA